MKDSQKAAREMRSIVRVNEEIKRVVATAFKINLMAMNAIFLAKRAGTSALGFGVLSNELRRFAMDLQAQMNTLREMTTGSVATITALLQQTRLNRIIDRTRKECREDARRMVDRIVGERHGARLASRQEEIDRLNRRLNQAIADTAQLVELGSVLARSAKIEAAYGGGFSASLMQVSSDFERTIGEIQRSLENLTKHHSEELAA